MLIFHSNLGSAILDTVIPPTSIAPTPPSAPAARLASSTTASPSWPRKIAGQTTSSLSELIKAYSQNMSFPLFPRDQTTTPYHSCSGPASHRNPNLYKALKTMAKTYPGIKWLLLDSSLDLRVTIDWFASFCITYPAWNNCSKNTNIEGRYGKRTGFFLLLSCSCILCVLLYFPVAIVCETCDIRLMFWSTEQARLGWLLLYLNSHVLFLNVYGFENLALFYFTELSIS